jgi:hypothetical protein
LHTQKSWFSNTQNPMMLRRLPRRFWLSAWNKFLTGEFPLSKSLAKEYYLEQLALKKDHHRRIANRLTGKFNVSAAEVKDELLFDGFIKLDKTVPTGKMGKNNYYYVLNDKAMISDEKPVVIDTFWPCGTKKSTGNAFDLSTAKGLFTKSELAASAFKGSPKNYNSAVQVIAYSRA